MSAMLQVQSLTLAIGETSILDSVSLHVAEGETLGLVGESGSGKSMTALAIMGLPPPGAQLRGEIRFDGTDLLTLSEADMRRVRGRDIAMAFQEPMTALNPVQTIGSQVAESFRLHRSATRRESLALARETLDRVGLPLNQFPLDRYPHELSGGQRQRVVIAIALALRPKLLIADEPTTALDVTTEVQILNLLRRLCDEDGTGLLFITHDLASIAKMADRVAVMKDGKIVEQGETTVLFDTMKHPYTRRLRAASQLTLSRARELSAHAPTVLEARGVARDYILPRKRILEKTRTFRAADDISFTLRKGESIGLVGESGSGKSTVARAVLGLESLQSGEVHLCGEPFSTAKPTDMRRLRRHIQVVFQDPYGSFNPRHKVRRLVAEPLHLLDTALESSERSDRVAASLENVGLSASDLDKYPHEFSGGQRQRIAIARALVVEPSVVVLDEATSALDVSVRAQILELLLDLSDRLGLSYLFISHDLKVVNAVTDRVMVMKDGRIIEQGETQSVFTNPRHPYTASLIEATPNLDSALEVRRERIQGPSE